MRVLLLDPQLRYLLISSRPKAISYLLAYYFLKTYNSIIGKRITDIREEVLTILQAYNYPGNIRELENIVNHMVSVETTHVLQKSSLPQYFLDTFAKHQSKGPFEVRSLEEIEKEHIRKVLEYTGGNRTQATKILGISRVSLIKKVKKYQLAEAPARQGTRPAPSNPTS